MDPALKQRLIGAAVLVALAVIFLPLLLGRPAPQPRHVSDVPLDVPPEPGRTLQTREVPLTLPPPSVDTSTTVAADPDAVVTVDTDSTPRVEALQPVATDPAAATPGAAVADAASAPAPTSPPAATAEPAATPASPTPAPVTTAAAPSAPVAAPPAQADASAPPAGARFVVNLGSYGNRANADALAARLRQVGMPLLVEPLTLDGRPATRLRAGPYATRGEAESARLAVRRLQSDLPASVVALADDDNPAARPAAAAVAAGFAVQVGALRAEAEANALRDRVRRAGFAGYTERTDTDAGTLWRVRAGPELTRERAERLRGELRGKLALDGIVVSHP